MKKLFLSLLISVLFTGTGAVVLIGQVAAQTGDCNLDGSVDYADVIYLINYLFKAEHQPPLSPFDADIDGHAGLDVGDVLQYLGYLNYAYNIQPFTGANAKSTCEIRLSADPINFEEGETTTEVGILIAENNGPDLMGMVITLSYENEPGQVEVILDSVSYVGSIIPFEWGVSTSDGSLENIFGSRGGGLERASIPMFSIDRNNKTVGLYPTASVPTDPPIAAGTTGLIATLHFTMDQSGYSYALNTAELTPAHSLMLIRWYCADDNGSPPDERMLLPSLTKKGDTNCNNDVEPADIVYLLNYFFGNGPFPCGL
jgi:hypothetical protein